MSKQTTPGIMSAARLAEVRAAMVGAPTVALASSHGSIFPADEAEREARIARGLDPTIVQVYGTNEEAWPWAEFFAAAPAMVRDLLAHLDALHAGPPASNPLGWSDDDWSMGTSEDTKNAALTAWERGRAVDCVTRGKPPMRNLNRTIAVCKARGWFQTDRWDGWEHELTPAGREAARRAP
jgi:hypothetical protein